jgi:hypothetical protein
VTRILGLPEKYAGLLVELTAAIAWENHRTRFNRALGMGYGGFSKGSYCLLAGDSEEGRIPRMEVHE